ncbi:hypothetical protein B0H17DRAFT_1077998, partial [Mycena rosella]
MSVQALQIFKKKMGISRAPCWASEEERHCRKLSDDISRVGQGLRALAHFYFPVIEYQSLPDPICGS